MTSNSSISSGKATVSVVIPAYNEAKHIRRTLDALCVQTLPAEQFEVIVVDNGSTDQTLEIAKGFSNRLVLRVVSKTGCRISAVRNYGASLATGNVLAFLDADCIAPENWLELSLALETPRTVWGAHYLVPQNSSWVGRVWFENQARAQEGSVTFLPGGDLFIRADDFLELGGFGENLTTSEDVELCGRARKGGLSVLAYPAVAVYHEGTPQTLGHFYRQNRWHGTTVLRNFFANLPSTANLPLVFLSFYTLLCFWAMLLLVVLIPFSHRPGAALFCLCLLALPAAVLSGTRITRSRRWADTGYLFVLYMTYLLARAASLTKVSKRNHR